MRQAQSSNSVKHAKFKIGIHTTMDSLAGKLITGSLFSISLIISATALTNSAIWLIIASIAGTAILIIITFKDIYLFARMLIGLIKIYFHPSLMTSVLDDLGYGDSDSNDSATSISVDGEGSKRGGEK